ncbi:MAG TPA: response regulator [Alphaproteobacteria bacterium]|nr:response regulator [Alphaproteobacteria bacterium]
MERSRHLLVVDDDAEIRRLLSRFLSQHGFRVTAVGNGREMRQALQDWRIDLVVLDLMLPGEDGIALCRELRTKSSLPVIMLTAMVEENDRILGLEIGADDYLGKPFNPRELVARIRAVFRRSGAPEEPAALPEGQRTVRFNGWTVDVGRRELRSPDSVVVDLTSGEFALLSAFISHPQRVLSRDQLVDMTRGQSAALFDRSIDIQVCRLRRKIESDNKEPSLIKTVRGEGYVFTAPVEAVQAAPT